MWNNRRRLTAALILIIAVYFSYSWWNEAGQWVIPVGTKAGSLLGRTICIDPGHGGRDPGAVWGKIMEKNLNLNMARELEKILRKEGVRVVLTRTGDQNRAIKPRNGSYQLAELFLRARTSAINKAELYISIHCNSEKTRTYYGPQTFYEQNDPKGARLAKEIQKELVSLRPTNRKAISGKYYLLEKVTVPTVIVEVGYLSHGGDRSLLQQASFRRQAAGAIARGIKNYFKK